MQELFKDPKKKYDDMGFNQQLIKILHFTQWLKKHPYKDFVDYIKIMIKTDLYISLSQEVALYGI